MKRLACAILIAAALWFVMFAPCTAPRVNFWLAMSISAAILTACALCFGQLRQQLRANWLQEALLALALAAALWGVFWVGDKLSQLMFDFARPQVNGIYAMKDGTSPGLIALLLLCLIGPAEEIFWRGYVQHTLSQRFSPKAGFIIATAIYTLVHLPSLNFMLIMAAMVCGICWGGLYRLLPRHFPAILLSHALWDAAAFVWFPF